MIQLNYDKIKEKEVELTQFEGWLPFRLQSFISLRERNEYLISRGLFDKIQKKNAHYKYLLMNSDDAPEIEDKLLKEFIVNNPQFSGIIEKKS